ncbi:nuclease domain-containing protein [Paenibacillus illinoisensis]|uniref:nuclease domain-containing protein n=1 Tax=Paenibacillus illinoisensis TaxID=59845 RepID=UPI003A4DC82D
MVKVWYNHGQEPQNELLPISSINIGDKIAQNNKNEWVISNHYRSQNENFMRQIGIRFVSKKSNVTTLSISSPDGNFRSDFYYYPKENIWFEPTHFSKKKRKGYYLFEESRILTGLTNAGSAKLSYEENGQYKDFSTIHFIPSSLPIEDYEEMIADLYRIREDIVRDDRNIARVGINLNLSKVVMELQEQLRKLKVSIKQINANPHSTLTLQTTKKKPQNHGRFDLRMEIGQYINPGIPSYRSHELKPVVTTYENMIIKQMLLDLVRYASAMGSNEITTKSLLNSLLNERDVCFRKSDLEIQRLLGSVNQVEDKETYKRVYNKLMEDMQQYLDEENSIRKDIKLYANYNKIPNTKSDTEYVELMLEMNGSFTNNNQYYHLQSNQGLDAQLKYDCRQKHLKVRNYIIKNQSKVHDGSYFGKIYLSSEHVQSHMRFYKAFCEEAQQESINQPRSITICGRVRKQPFGVDAVSTSQVNKYLDYTFDFVYISNILVDGIDIDIPSDKNSIIAFLDNELPVMMNNADQSEDSFMRLKQLEKLQSLTNQMEEIHNVSKKYDGLKEAAEELLKLNLFSKLELKGRLPIKPTQLFLHNPIYRVAWQAMQQIKYELSASLYVQQHQRQVSTVKVEYIFEVWTLYKIIHTLTKEMGWRLDRKKEVTASLDQYMVEGATVQAFQNFSVTLHWQHWELELYYEPKINLLFDTYLTPDFVFKFKRNGRTMGLVILDAKYRNYKSQGIEKWVKDINDIAINKYGNMQSIETKWKFPILASGILHSDVKISDDNEDKYNPYHVMYNETLFNTNLSNEKAHKYGSIYMIPSRTYVFKNWFRLIMEYHLNEHKVCWNCGGTEEVQERQLLTQFGYPKYYYTCQSCNEFWVKVHCRSNRHKIIKHMNNYHLQVENRRKWWVICPSCGDGRPAQQNTVTSNLFE